MPILGATVDRGVHCERGQGNRFSVPARLTTKQEWQVSVDGAGRTMSGLPAPGLNRTLPSFM